MESEIRIGNRLIGAGQPPFVIAEMSGNHNQSIDRALQIVDAVAQTGAHAIKIQTYKPETMTLEIADGEFQISDPRSPWVGTSLYDLYGKAQTPWEWHEAIFQRARSKGLVAFSSPFDSSAIDFLEGLDAPCYKIASFELTDLPLIRKAASTGKPLIISTGMATLSELDDSVVAARDAGCKELILLKCTSTYPASAANTNIVTIPQMRALFDCQVGLSDHTGGIGVSVASVALGATVIEKHFTLSRADGGVDSSFSMEPSEFDQLVAETRRAWEALGCVLFGPTPEERASLQYRRSLYVVQDLKAGAVLTAENVRAIRPGLGLPTKYLQHFLGKTLNRDVRRGTPLQWDLIG